MSRADAHEVYSVSRLNQEVRGLLEQAFPLIWVEGEISNLAQPRSGHVYFTLKDAEAQVRCALFRNRALRLRFSPENGARVRIRARIGLYAPRGEYQLIAEHMEPAGDGDLQQAFEALKRRLGAEGLFETARKRPLPALPRQLGIVTSPTGAAIRDILSVLSRRFPALPVLIYPVAVQGAAAAQDIATTLALANQRRDVDVLVVSRGGGSLEDLQAFNEEAVARAIATSAIPVVSAVGHEVDITIADLVADHRAPTPSAAAEQLSPDGSALVQTFQQLRRRLIEGHRRLRDQRRERLDRVSRRLEAQHPGRRLQERSQRLDELELRLTRALRQRLDARALGVTNLAQRLRTANPGRAVAQHRSHCQTLTTRLAIAMRAGLTQRRGRLQENARALEAVSPLATLERGYAIVRHGDDGRILRDAGELAVGDSIQARLGQGTLDAKVTSIQPAPAKPDE